MGPMLKLIQSAIIVLVGGWINNAAPEQGLFAAGLMGVFAAIIFTVGPLRLWVVVAAGSIAVPIHMENDFHG